MTSSDVKNESGQGRSDATPARRWRRHCPHCDYDLTGTIAAWTEACPLSSRCSECGEAIDWPELMRAARPPAPWSMEFAASSVAAVPRFVGTLERTLTGETVVAGALCDVGEERGRIRRLGVGRFIAAVLSTLPLLAIGLANTPSLLGMNIDMADAVAGAIGIVGIAGIHTLVAWMAIDTVGMVGVVDEVRDRAQRRTVVTAGWPVALGAGALMATAAVLVGPFGIPATITLLVLFVGPAATVGWCLSLQHRLHAAVGSPVTTADRWAVVLRLAAAYPLALLLVGFLAFIAIGTMLAVADAFF